MVAGPSVMPSLAARAAVLLENGGLLLEVLGQCYEPAIFYQVGRAMSKGLLSQEEHEYVQYWASGS
jgi:hypothetical protein